MCIGHTYNMVKRTSVSYCYNSNNCIHKIPVWLDVLRYEALSAKPGYTLIVAACREVWMSTNACTHALIQDLRKFGIANHTCDYTTGQLHPLMPTIIHKTIINPATTMLRNKKCLKKLLFLKKVTLACSIFFCSFHLPALVLHLQPQQTVHIKSFVSLWHWVLVHEKLHWVGSSQSTVVDDTVIALSTLLRLDTAGNS